MNRYLRFGVIVVCAGLFGCGSDSSNSSKGGKTKPDAGNAGKSDAGKGGKSNADGGSSSGDSDASAANDAGGGATGSGDGPSSGKPFMPKGDKLTADDMKWTWVDFPGTTCRDGSMAGISVSLNSKSDKLMIYLEGGGACFDSLTCLGNPANVSAQMGEVKVGIFARDNAKNPVKDWNWVYVPFCTGDVHLGAKDDGNVDGVGPQHFTGRTNLVAFLNRIVPTFADAKQVLLTGASAGGFGAAGNGEYVKWAFGDVPVTLLDDSGPSMSSTYVPSCLQKKWRETWGFDNTILADCGKDCPNKDDFEFDYTKHVAKKAGDSLAGLISSTDDGTITLFFGYGTDNCAPTSSALTPVSAADFKAGLLEYRKLLQDVYPKYGTYFIDGTKHTWIVDDGFYTTTTGPDKVLLVDWVTDIINGKGAPHVGP